MPPPQTAHEDTEEDTADDDEGEGHDDGSDAIFLGRLSKFRQSDLPTAVPFSIDETAAATATANPATDANGFSPDMICTAIKENKLHTPHMAR